MSTLDRFLISDIMIKNLDIVGQSIGDRDVSDHCLVWIIVDASNWGPKPNCVNNEWFSNKDFQAYVEFEWRSIEVTRMGDLILKEKLRILKSKLTT